MMGFRMLATREQLWGAGSFHWIGIKTALASDKRLLFCSKFNEPKMYFTRSPVNKGLMLR